MFERFTQQARIVAVRAQEEARGLDHGYIGTEHLLLALLNEDAGVAYTVLHTAGLNQKQARAAARRLAAGRPRPLGAGDAEALREIGIDLNAVRARVEAAFGPGALSAVPQPRRRGLLRRRCQPMSGEIPFTPNSKKALELSWREAQRLHDGSIDTGHLLLGLLHDGDGLAVAILRGAGLTPDRLREQTLAALGKAA